MKDNREALRPYVADMIALEKHILEAAERQRNDDDLKDHPRALDLVTRLESLLRRHVEVLESHAETFPGGGLASGVKGAVTGVLGALAGLYDRVRKDPVSRLLRDDYTALSLAVISYTMLHSTALGLKQPATADLALRNLRELTPFVTELSRLIPGVVLHELAGEDYPIDPAVEQQALRNTQETWSRENVGAVAEQAVPVGTF